MFTQSIRFKNFKFKKKNPLVKKKLFSLLKDNIEVIKSLKKSYIDSFNRKKLSSLKKFQNYRLIGMGGSSLGAEAIYDFFGNKIKKNFLFNNNLVSRLDVDKKKDL